MAKSDSKTETTTKTPKYTKDAWLKNINLSAINRDILNIVLIDGKEYSEADVKKELKIFKEGI